MSEEAKLRILIETILDERAAKMAAESVNKVKENAKATGNEIKKADGAMQALGKSTSSLIGTFTKIGVAIAGGVAPLMVASKQYVQSVNLAEVTSRNWLSTQYEIQQSQTKINRVIAQETLPYYQKYSEILRNISDYAEKNPEATTAITAAGGVASVLGGMSLIGKLVGGGKAGAGGAGWLSRVLGGGAAAGGMTETTAAATAGATGGGLAAAGVAVAGTILGLLAYQGISNTKLGKQLGFLDVRSKEWQANAKENISQTAGKIGGDIGALFSYLDKDKSGQSYSQRYMEAGEAVYEFTNALVNGKTTLKSLLGGGKSGVLTPGQQNDATTNTLMETGMLWKMNDYQRQERYALEDFNRQKFVAQRDFNRQYMYAEMDFYRQRGYSYRDFQINMAFTEKMFYLQRAIQLRDFNISVARNDYDYALSRKRAAEDHNFQLKQIMLSGDALQYYYAQRQWNIDKQRAEEDYQLQKARAREDFNRQQGDSLYMFQIERAQQKKQFDIRMNDQLVEFTISRARQVEQFNIQMQDMDFMFSRERTRRWEAFEREVLPQILLEEEQKAYLVKNMTETMVGNYNALMSKFVSDWSTWWAKAGNLTYGAAVGGASGRAGADYTYIPMNASGGYTRGGLAMMHDNKFVMNAQTTKTAELVAKGTLTQDKILNMLAGGGGGFTYNDSRQFSRGLDPDEKQILRDELRQIIVEAVR